MFKKRNEVTKPQGGEVTIEERNIYNPFSHNNVEGNKKSTGFEYLDIVLGGGYEPKTLMVLQGKAKIGKSTMMSNMAVRAALLGSNVGIFTIELGSNKYVKRVGSNLFNVPANEYGRDSSIIHSAIKMFREQHPDAGEIDITESLTGATEVSDIEKHYVEWERINGKKLDVIFVDNLNLLHADESLDWNMYLYVKRICEDLRKIAQKNNWCVVTAAATKHGQFNDDMDMYSSAESSAIATVADSIFGLMGQPGSPYLKMKCLGNRDRGYINSYAEFVKDMNFFRINEDGEDYMNLGEWAILDAERIPRMHEALSKTYDEFQYRVMKNGGGQTTVE